MQAGRLAGCCAKLEASIWAIWDQRHLVPASGEENNPTAGREPDDMPHGRSTVSTVQILHQEELGRVQNLTDGGLSNVKCQWIGVDACKTQTPGSWQSIDRLAGVGDPSPQ